MGITCSTPGVLSIWLKSAPLRASTTPMMVRSAPRVGCGLYPIDSSDLMTPSVGHGGVRLHDHDHGTMLLESTVFGHSITNATARRPPNYRVCWRTLAKKSPTRPAAARAGPSAASCMRRLPMITPSDAVAISAAASGLETPKPT